MTSSPHDPGRYTLGKLGRRLLSRGPQLARGVPDLLAGLSGENSLGLQTRLAVQVRMARLQGCPVCLEIFPRLAPSVGLAAPILERAGEGQLEGLPLQMQGALAWVEEVILADGELPEIVPAAATELTATQRSHLLFLVRLELVIHSAGLMFLPHSLIKKAAGL